MISILKILYLSKPYIHVIKEDNKFRTNKVKEYISDLYKNYAGKPPFAVASSGNLISITVDGNVNIKSILADVIPYIKILNINRYELEGNVQQVVELEVNDNYIDPRTLRNLYYKYGSVPTINNVNGTIVLSTNTRLIENQGGSVKICVGELSDKGDLNSIQTEFGTVNLGRTILSNQFSDFIDHAEPTSAGVVITLKPYAFQVLCKHAEQNPNEKVVVVVNDKIYYAPIKFIPKHGSPSPRMVVCVKQPAHVTKEICHSIYQGFYKIEVVNTTQDTHTNKNTLILILVLLSILLILLIVNKRRRKGVQMILNTGLMYGMLEIEQFLATLIVSLILYFTSLFINEKRQMIGISLLGAVIFLHPLLKSVLLKVWSILIFESCLSFVIVGAICITLLPEDKK